jgi:transcriptional regulator with XRE-family HTH domain
MEPFGTRLRIARERAGMTPLQLATKAGVREGDVYRWERTPEMDVRSSSVRALAPVLQVTADYLLGLADMPPEPEQAEVSAEPAVPPAGERAVPLRSGDREDDRPGAPAAAKGSARRRQR